MKGFGNSGRENAAGLKPFEITGGQFRVVQNSEMGWLPMVSLTPRSRSVLKRAAQPLPHGRGSVTFSLFRDPFPSGALGASDHLIHWMLFDELVNGCGRSSLHHILIKSRLTSLYRRVTIDANKQILCLLFHASPKVVGKSAPAFGFSSNLVPSFGVDARTRTISRFVNIVGYRLAIG
jgi:hypothetical protein